MLQASRKQHRGATTMAEVAESRKQRLRTLENQIRKNYEAFVQTGFALKEIRDDLLYKEDGFETWDQYLNERVAEDFGIEERQVFNLIACAQVREKIPETFCSVLQKEGLTQRELLEFARLAPKDEEAPGRPYDFGKLNRRDVERVANKVVKHCKQEEVKPTSTVVRKFVDEELGIDRAAQAKETKRQREEEQEELDRKLEEENNPDAEKFFNDTIIRMKLDAIALRDRMEEDAEGWKQWRSENPGLVKRLTTACKDLADLLEGG
jgi:hypothetical protein